MNTRPMNCGTCKHNKCGVCTRLNKQALDDHFNFMCDLYRMKTSGAFRRKMAKLNAGNDVTYIIGTRGAGKRYVMEGMTNDQIKK